MEMQNLRKLRLLLEDFPKNHNLILVGQPYLIQNISLEASPNYDNNLGKQPKSYDD